MAPACLADTEQMTVTTGNDSNKQLRTNISHLPHPVARGVNCAQLYRVHSFPFQCLSLNFFRHYASEVRMATIRSSSGEPLSRFIAPACLSVGSEDVQPAPLGLRRDFKVYRNRYLQLQAYQNLMEAIAAGESDNSKADDDVSGKVAHVLKIVEKSRASKTSLVDALERASISASALEALQMQAADATVVVNRALETSRAGKTEDEEKCKELLREQTEAIRVVTDEKDAFQNELYDLDCKRVPLLQRLRSNRAKLEELKHFSIDASTAATRVERLTEIQRWYDCINSVLSSVWGVRLLAESIGESFWLV